MDHRETPFWDLNDRISDRLMIWSAVSVLFGALAIVRNKPFLRGVGAHFVTWGLIDAGIARLGHRNNAKSRQLPLDEQPEKELADARNVRRLLWINTFLDIGYLAGGWWLYTQKGREDEQWRGQGVGVYIQAGFLFIFDLVHAVIVGRLIRSRR